MKKAANASADGPRLLIGAGDVVREVLKRHPETQAVFAAHDLDLCCGGVHPIGVAAQANGVRLEELLADLNTAADSHAAKHKKRGNALGHIS